MEEKDLTGIETRTDAQNVTQYRSYIKRDGQKVRGPWTYSYDEAFIWRRMSGDGVEPDQTLSLGEGYVYFIRAGSDGPIKVGWSSGFPHKRMNELQVGNHEELCLLGCMRGTVADERRVHRALDHLRIRGEWFGPAGSVLTDLMSAFGSQGLRIHLP